MVVFLFRFYIVEGEINFLELLRRGCFFRINSYPFRVGCAWRLEIIFCSFFLCKEILHGEFIRTAATRAIVVYGSDRHVGPCVVNRGWWNICGWTRFVVLYDEGRGSSWLGIFPCHTNLPRMLTRT